MIKAIDHYFKCSRIGMTPEWENNLAPGNRRTPYKKFWTMDEALLYSGACPWEDDTSSISTEEICDNAVRILKDDAAVEAFLKEKGII